MGKFVENSYANETGILAFKDHYVAFAAMADASKVTADSAGKKILPRGSVVCGLLKSVLEDRTQLLRPCNFTDGTASPTIAAKAVALNVATMGLVAGKVGILKTVFTPANATDQTGVWASSDETKATVAGGVVTAVANGTTNVTFTSTDGAFVVTCAVTVSAAGATTTATNVPASGVALTSEEIYLQPADVYTVLAKMQPSNATTATVVWASSNTAVATVNAGAITAVAAGTAVITATTTDGSFVASVTVRVNAKADGILFNDVDLTYGNAPASVIIHGYIKTSALPVALSTKTRNGFAPGVNLAFIDD